MVSQEWARELFPLLRGRIDDASRLVGRRRYEDAAIQLLALAALAEDAARVLDRDADLRAMAYGGAEVDRAVRRIGG